MNPEYAFRGFSSTPKYFYESYFTNPNFSMQYLHVYPCTFTLIDINVGGVKSGCHHRKT